MRQPDCGVLTSSIFADCDSSTSAFGVLRLVFPMTASTSTVA